MVLRELKFWGRIQFWGRSELIKNVLLAARSSCCRKKASRQNINSGSLHRGVTAKSGDFISCPRILITVADGRKRPNESLRVLCKAAMLILCATVRMRMQVQMQTIYDLTLVVRCIDACVQTRAEQDSLTRHLGSWQMSYVGRSPLK